MSDPVEPEDNPRKPNALQQGLKYLHVAFIIPTAVIVGWLLGALVDRWLGTTWVYLLGLGLGVVAGFYDMIRTMIQMNKDIQ